MMTCTHGPGVLDEVAQASPRPRASHPVRQQTQVPRVSAYLHSDWGQSQSHSEDIYEHLHENYFNCFIAAYILWALLLELENVINKYHHKWRL